MTGYHDHAPLTYGILLVDKYQSHEMVTGKGGKLVCYSHLGLGKRSPGFAIGSVRNNGIYGDFLCMDFLFAVISMHHNVHELVAYGCTETCPFIRDPFSRGDMVGLLSNTCMPFL